MPEQRQSFRNRTYLVGHAIFANRLCTTDCLVRNLTTYGARLEFSNTAGIPSTFNLTIGNRPFDRTANVVWRTPSALGVALA